MSTKVVAINNKVKKAQKELDTYKQEMDDLLEQLESQEGLDSAMVAMQRDQLRRLLRLIPIAEQAFKERPGQGSAVALNGLISQVREIFYDIQNRKDYEQLALELRQKTLSPEFVTLTQEMVDSIYRLRKQLEPFIPANKVGKVNTILETSAKELAMSLQKSFNSISEKLMERLTEE